ncbi:hypothetical protein ABIC21_003718 [Pseudarthrobacter sp. PvP090]
MRLAWFRLEALVPRLVPRTDDSVTRGGLKILSAGIDGPCLWVER